ncbi:HTH-type transcriptional regulator CymR [Collinsella sp. AK_207A]|uniref:RrF2 family transcriptional regulator n=1 Tax=Collinsella sp. AK_207A TaxID=2650472 RepID=UPI0012612193|nr:Rrf2 family transcriptional regulator [Collinsella sp. AK_207A]VWM00436.1 HTH-type transcriptional regulator CymR [Collinsella sp. AK_207A]
MLISTKGRYALRVMVDLAEHQAAGRIPLKEIADRQGVSEKYLENILATLVRAGLLSGMRGKGGGYRLTRDPDKYTAGEILRLTEGSLAPVSCLEGGNNGCERAGECRTIGMWRELDEMISNYLDGITVADLVAKPMEYDFVI